jgi:hypothetical protein
MLYEVFYQGSTFLEVKDYEMITLKLQTKNMHGNTKESLDDFIFLQRVLNFLQKVYSRWSVFYQLTFDNFGWAW